MQPPITLLVPALNEYEGLKEYLPLIPKHLFQQIIVADGQSKDLSVQWLRENSYEVYVQKNRGIRNAYLEVWPLLKGEYVVTFSPDGNCKVEDLAALCEELKKGHDMVIASRYKPPAYSEDDDALTRFGNFFFTSLISICFRHKFTDSMTIYRGYRTSLFYDLNIEKSRVSWLEKKLKTSVGVEPLLSIRAAKKGLSIGEIPSVEPLRKHGVRKMLPFKWGFLILTQIILEFITND